MLWLPLRIGYSHALSYLIICETKRCTRSRAVFIWYTFRAWLPRQQAGTQRLLAFKHPCSYSCRMSRPFLSRNNIPGTLVFGTHRCNHLDTVGPPRQHLVHYGPRWQRLWVGNRMVCFTKTIFQNDAEKNGLFRLGYWYSQMYMSKWGTQGSGWVRCIQNTALSPCLCRESVGIISSQPRC